MNEIYIYTVIALIAVSMSITLLVVVPILLHINKQQKRNNEIISAAITVIKIFTDNVNNTEILISENFKDVLAKTLIVDSKQVSIKDSIDAIAKSILIYRNDTIKAIGGMKKPQNKQSNQTKPYRLPNTRDRDNNSL